MHDIRLRLLYSVVFLAISALFAFPLPDNLMPVPFLILGGGFSFIRLNQHLYFVWGVLSLYIACAAFWCLVNNRLSWILLVIVQLLWLAIGAHVGITLTLI
jgi:hypothetical protein